MRTSEVDSESFIRISDTESTRSIYARFVPHVCACACCRNYRAHAEPVPPQVRSLLVSMGVDPEKPNEILEFGKSKQGGRVYEPEWAFLATAPLPAGASVTT